MPEKVVSVRMVARVEGMVGPLRSAKAAVDDLTKAAGPSKADAFAKLSDRAALAGVGVATAMGVAVKRFADFDAAMSAVKANSGATGASLESLREAAVRMGADSQFSAKEAADGINGLAKAGVSTGNILGGGLKGSLDLAAAGQISVAEAAETAASAMTQFGLSGEKVPHIADLLTNAANKAQGGVGDMGEALKQAGLVAAAAGLSIEETTAGLTAFASAGLIGSDAGTSFKTMLQRLNPTTEAAKSAMSELGINAYDAQGNFIGLEAVAGQLKTGMSGLSQEQRSAAMSTIFGSDAVRAANVLYGEGAEGIAKWTSEVTEQGAAAAQAAILTDNLKGDVERLGGALDSVFIQAGSGGNSALRGLTQGVTGLVEVIGRVPGPVLLAGGALTALALVGPKAVTSFREYKANLDTLGLSMDKISTKAPRAASALSGIGKAAGGIAGALTALSVANSAFSSGLERLGTEGLIGDLANLDGGLAAVNKRFSETSRASTALGSAETHIKSVGDALKIAFDPGINANIENFGGSIGSVFGIENTSQIETAKVRLSELDGALSQLVSSGRADTAASQFQAIASEAAKQGVSVDQLKAKFPQYAEALAGAANSAAGAAGEIDKVTDAADTNADGMVDAAEAADAYTEALEGVQSAVVKMGGGLRAEQQAVRDAAEAYRGAQESVKGSSLEQKAALSELSESFLQLAAAQIGAGRGSSEVGATMAANRQQFIDTALAMGLNATYAGELADAYGLIPEQVQTMVSQVGAETAVSEVTDLNASILGLDDKTVTIAEAGANPSKQRVLELDGAIFGLDGKTVAVKELGASASGERVVAFQGKIFRLTGKTVPVGVSGVAQAINSVQYLQRTITNTQGKTVTVTTRLVTEGKSAYGGVTRAAGGPVWGAGTATSDDIPAWLSNGEFVQRTRSAQHWGYGVMHELNSLNLSSASLNKLALLSGHPARFANGGAVASSSRFAPTSFRPVVQVSQTSSATAVRAEFTDAQVNYLAKKLGERMFEAQNDAARGIAGRSVVTRRSGP